MQSTDWTELTVSPLLALKKKKSTNCNGKEISYSVLIRISIYAGGLIE
jgi:hypothetical protein